MFLFITKNVEHKVGIILKNGDADGRKGNSQGLSAKRD